MIGAAIASLRAKLIYSENTMRPTNMLVLMADQHNPKMLGCRGHDWIKTPNLDALAQRGIKFDYAYSNSALCVPARASFATGRYPHDTKCWDNAIAYDGSQPSWGHRLQKNGNEVVSIGKLHYTNEDDDTGFDEQILPMHINGGVGDLHGSIRPNLPVRYQGRQYVVEVGPGHTKYQDYDRDITAAACDWLSDKGENKSDKPWVCFVSLIGPHFPIIAPQEYYDMYSLDELPPFKPADEELFENHPWWQAFNKSFIYEEFFRDDEHRKIALAAYLGLCTLMDNNMGKVIKALDEAGLSGDTRIMYTSDHGDNIGARRLWGKSTMHEESTGVPLIMAGPDIPEGQLSETPVSLIDFFPTILEGAGAPMGKGDEDLPGMSLLRIADAGDDAERIVFAEYHAAGATSAAFMIRGGRYKYIHYAGGFDPELYDMEIDPEEMDNVAGDPNYADALSEMRKYLLDMLDPEAVNAEALADQAALIEKHGGAEALIAKGAANNTPVPGTEQVIFKPE